MTRDFIAALVATGIVIALAWLGVTSQLGAHPVAWPVQVAVIGAPVGAILAILAGLAVPSRPLRVVVFAVLMVAAWGLAHRGKLDFVASFADDRVAGQFWYYGWIATCAMATAVLAAAGGRRGRA